MFSLRTELNSSVCQWGCEENVVVPLYNETKLQICHLHIRINGLAYATLNLKIAVQIPDIIHKSFAFSKI